MSGKIDLLNNYGKLVMLRYAFDKNKIGKDEA
jgi:hypothetical protein